MEEVIKILEKLRKELGLYADGNKVKQGKAIENLIKRNKELEEQNSMLRKVNKIVDSVTTEDIERTLLEAGEDLKNNYIPKSKIKQILKCRLKKYQEDDDGRYEEKEYLTRGELELVDRYKECSELLKLFCDEDIYKIKLDYIPKSLVEEKIEEIKKYEDVAREQIQAKVIIADSDSLNFGRKQAHGKDIEVLQELLKGE